MVHENEIIVNKSVVRSLIKNQCPHWAHLSPKAIPSCGSDNVLFKLGNKYVVRLRRTGRAIQSVHKEYEWVPKIARFLPTPISEPVFKGDPDKSYPWPWLVHKWNEGENPPFEKKNEYEQLAEDLAHFLNRLHQIKLSDGPSSRLGMPLKERDAEVKAAINKLSNEMDTKHFTELWEQLSSVYSYSCESVWIHGDFLPINILIKNRRLSAVIDFTDLGLGDPACDLIVAWSLFNSHSRRIFKENLQDIDEDTWHRGRVWALSIALIVLPIYKDKNPTIASLARRIIKNVTQSLQDIQF